MSTTTSQFEIVLTASGIEPEREIEIRDAFAPFAEKVSTWGARIAGISDPKLARENRLAMRRERIELDKKHEQFKARTLAWTRAVDGSKRAITEAYDSMEEQMAEIEKAEERRLAAEKAARKAERDAALRQYGVDTTYIQTGDMTDAAFLGMLEQAKLAHAAKIEAERAAKEKVAAEAKAAAEAAAAKAKADAEERERQRAENERLRKEAAEREAAAKAERERVAAERAAAEAKARIEREAIEVKLAEERKARADAEAKAIEAREKLEREVAAKAEAERIAKEAAETEARRIAAAPDADKLRDWARRVREVAAQCGTLNTDAAKTVAQSIHEHLNKTAARMIEAAAKLSS